MVASSKRPHNQPVPHACTLLDTDEYDALPVPIRMSVSPREYLFMTDTQKASIIEDDCEPEY